MMLGSHKIRIQCLIIVSLFSSFLKAQCFLSNGSFERWEPLPPFALCPGGIDSGNLIKWRQPFDYNGSTPDYFSTCFNGIVPNCSQGTCIPLNLAGYQNAHSGTAYAGIINYYPPPLPDTFIINREYIEVKLDTLLLSGKCYHFKMYCSYGDSVSYYASPTIGAYFSDTLVKGTPSVHGETFLNLTPQIENNSNNWDTINWFVVEGNYVAHGGEQYITIGNFHTDNETVLYRYRNCIYNFSYLYLDDVSLIPCEADTIHGEHYTLCYGDSITLQLDSLAPMPTSPCNASLNYCHWHDKRHTPLYSGFNYTIKPTRDTVLYTIRGNDTCSCGYYQDSFVIHVVPPVGNEKNHYDTLCAGETKQLIADTLQATYKWYNYSNVLVANTKAYSVNPVNSTKYYLILQDTLQLCATRTDTFNVQVLDPPCAKIAIPTAFSPNGDGNNDVFAPIFYQNNSSEMQMRIYNRWGEIVYNGNGAWDGKYKGVLQPNDTYFYVVNIKGEYFKGNVELLK